MESFLSFIHTNTFILMNLLINIILLVLVIIFIVQNIRNNKKYISFMNKLGNGNNLDEMLKKYLNWEWIKVNNFVWLNIHFFY